MPKPGYEATKKKVVSFTLHTLAWSFNWGRKWFLGSGATNVKFCVTLFLTISVGCYAAGNWMQYLEKFSKCILFNF